MTGTERSSAGPRVHLVQTDSFLCQKAENGFSRAIVMDDGRTHWDARSVICTRTRTPRQHKCIARSKSLLYFYFFLLSIFLFNADLNKILCNRVGFLFFSFCCSSFTPFSSSSCSLLPMCRTPHPSLPSLPPPCRVCGQVFSSSFSSPPLSPLRTRPRL